MNRRELLRRGSAITALIGLAGCIGSSPGSSPDETTTDPATTTSPEEFSGVRSDDDDPFRTISVGDRESVAFPDNNRVRDVRVWNDADESRKIDVEVSRSADIVVDRTIEFAADAYLAIDLNEPADYDIAVGLADGETTTFTVERSQFDCNDAGTDVGVMPDGRVETFGDSTAMGCPGPSVADSALSTGQGECGKAHSASVTFDGETVAVEGRVKTPTPQSDLELGAANYDADADALTVRVSDAGSGSEIGNQCIGEVPYEATVDFENALPAAVAVVHESMDETVEVTRTER
ncbi:hypothetical protein [Halorussus pelagicus]|uniref:hypothetical protein n=1 Tax=Halorussus pelagicus TaxID=2505977 RepID=UPI000FFB2FB9|nr:hypothetical protein [Halorussus pelagicus]